MPQSRPWRVLIIEDELVDREIYKGYLQPASLFECAEAASAAAGIAMCREWAPDCVLLDYNLPDMDGLEVLPQLGVSGDNPRCAVVMLTAFGGETLAVQAMKSGAMDYLPKGHLAAEVLPNTIIGAIQRFQVQQRIHEQRSAFEESALKRETLLEAIPQMVWACNAEGNVEYVNRAWFEYTGIAMEQAGRLGWDRLLHPDDQERTWSSWNTAVREGSLFEIEHRLKRALDGSYQWHLSRAVPIRGEHGEVTNWFGTCTGIENQKQAEKLAIQREKQEGIGRLAAGVAHDFNNLLVAVLGGAVYALDSLPPSHPAQNMLKGVVRAGERAATLTGKMLAYAGKGNLNAEQIDLNHLVHETCESMRSSLQKTVRLKVKAAGTTYFLMADSRQMRQVIVDLVLNAAEAIPDGAEGTITVSTADLEVGEGREVAPGHYVVLEVRDTGCGMDEETMNRIFDPFFSTKFTGRGMGLAAVRGFVRSSGGEVLIESAVGKGTCFRVLLPTSRVREEVRRAAG